MVAKLRLALEAEGERSAKKMEWIGFGFDLDLIWIEIGVFKNFKECARSPCNGNHFSSVIGLVSVYNWRASETLSGLFNRESWIYYMYML